MAANRGVKLYSVIERFNMEVLHRAENWREIEIHTEDVNRPGLQLAGFFDYFDETRLQVIGLVETSYMEPMSSEQRLQAFDRLFQYGFPALILARNIEPYPECLEMAAKHDKMVLRTQGRTAEVISDLIAELRSRMAPCITRHGVLVEVYGEGILLLGESGVGKSETAIELIKRGHRLIADDAVEIKRVGTSLLKGTAPDLIRYYMELRGIGVVDIRRLFGMSAVKKDCTIDMIINLETWRRDVVYDRLGADMAHTNILGVEVPTVTIPVRPGRNLAVIVEVAAMNHRNKEMGHNAALEFTRQVDAHLEQALAEQEAGQR